MATIKIKQEKSVIKTTHRQKNTMIALGLTKIGKVVTHEDSPAVLGMIDKVQHLVSVERDDKK